MINICIIATIVIYLVGMLLVGFVYSKSNEDSSDFYLGGRTMGPLVTAMSAEASDMSSWLLMGMPACISHRHRVAGLDGHRPCCGHMAQLAHRGPPPAPLLGQSGCHHGAAVPFPAVP